MSQPKAQLLDPQGNISLPGITATGVITATSLSGISTGSVTNLTGDPDLDVGIVTASSFIGQGSGHAANLAGTPQLNLGITSSTNFIGDAVGKAAGLTGTPNLNVGLITATSFVGFVTGNVTGNISGLAASVTPGVNLGVGVCTAIQYHGDGSTLTGAGSSAYIAQNIDANAAETIIDLSYGNLIYFDQNTPTTTVGFASTSAAEQITFIRDASRTKASFTTGAVDFDGDDYLTIPDNAAWDLGQTFTIEMWINIDALNGSGFNQIISQGTSSWYVSANGSGRFQFYDPSCDILTETTAVAAATGTWTHIAVVANAGTGQWYINGTANGSAETSVDVPGSSSAVAIASWPDGSYELDGKISNLRVVKGTAVYTADFNPPFFELENITNTVLLCCQSNSSTTTAAVTPGTITASGDPTAGAQTISSSTSGFSITWPDGVKWNNDTTPTLVTSTENYDPARQIFRFTTVDTGLNYNAWEEIVYNVDHPNTLWSWGSNTDTAGSYGYAGSLGQNNQGAPTDRSSPVQVGTDTTWYELSFSNSVLALKSDGTLWAWGNGSSGVSAQNDQIARSSPTQIPGTTWSKLGKEQGYYGHAFAHKTDGTLWAWGSGGEGALGINNIVSYSSPIQLPGTTWSITSSDGRSSFGIKTDGTLWAWGYNQQGRLGLRPNIPAGQGEEMFSSPVQMAGNLAPSGRETGWVAVVPRMAMNEDGTLWGWGQGDNGQGGKNDNNQSLSMVQIPGTNWGQDMSKISTDDNNTGAIKTDGTLWVWGRNDNYGQLGQNDRTTRSSPIQVPGTTWSSIHVGAMIMRAIKTDGTMWSWGRNDDERKGNLGLSNVGVHRSSPTQIPGTSWNQKAGGMAGYAAAQLTLKKSD
mgnify:CR=1 FL=1|jgi:alpha-tubulin suppressor-like RCC1 family protein